MREEEEIAEREICKFLQIFFIICKMPIIDIVNMLIFGCRQMEGLLHANKDPRPYLHHMPNSHLRPNLHPKPHPHLNPSHHLSPYQHISLILWPYPTKQQGHSHQLKLHGHNNQVNGTLQTSGTLLEELLGSLQASQHHTPLQKHGTLEHHHHRYCSFMFDVLFIKL